MSVTPEQLAAIPAEHRMVIARWLIEKTDGLNGSWLLPDTEVWAIASTLAGAAVDLADPLSEDSTIAHAEEVIAEIRAAEVAEPPSPRPRGRFTPDEVNRIVSQVWGGE